MPEIWAAGKPESDSNAAVLHTLARQKLLSQPAVTGSGAQAAAEQEVSIDQPTKTCSPLIDSSSVTLPHADAAVFAAYQLMRRCVLWCCSSVFHLQLLVQLSVG
jgi:hypothetical protein